MKKVVIVSTELGVGGAEKALTEIALRLPKFGFSPSLVSLRPRPISGRDFLVKKLEQANFSVRFLNATKATQFFSTVGQLRRIFDEVEADLALSFLFHANVITAFAARKRRLAHLAGIRVAELSGWRNRLEAWSLNRCEGVICVSERVKQNFVAYFRDEKRLSVIPNGVNSWQETPPVDLSSIGIGKEDPIILFAGRLHPQKGLDWALPHVGRLLADNENLQLLILGDGPQMESLERMALTVSSHERIHFLGFQPDLAAYLDRAQCLLLPSRWEGMPNVVLEAMAAGIPVLATHESSAGEILSAESPAQLFAFGNGDELVEKLSRLVRDRAFAMQIGAENREKSKQFSWDAIADQYARRFTTIS